MRVADFHFDLPEDLIAQHPPETRGDSHLLRIDRATGAWTDDRFASLPSLLNQGDLLILNDSRVLPARLFATRARSAHTQANSPSPSSRIEVLLTEQLPSAAGENLWSALVRPSRKVQPGETLLFADPTSEDRVPHLKQSHRLRWGAGATHPESSVPHSSQPHRDEWDGPPLLTAEVLTAGPFGERTLRFPSDPDFLAKLDQIGHIPLPPYLHRPDDLADKSRYQTVYAQTPGSAAAPTAGLHFTPEILAQLEVRGVEIAYITLHVGLGTFQPVRVDRLEDIRLHTEHYTLPPATAAAINRARAEHRRIIAAGTTTTRTLEHCAANLPGAPSQTASPSEVGCKPSTETIPDLQPHSGSTSIFLQPGHRFRLVSGLLTNFHLPQSTLLMLVSAFLSEHPTQGRDRALTAYTHAIRQRYRFFSYGDCMLIV